MASNDGIKQIGKNLFQVRVRRIEARTGRVRNRKETVRGSRKDAIRVRDQIRTELESTKATRPRTRLRDFALLWLERRKPSLKPGTFRKYGYQLQHVMPQVGDLYLDSITPGDIDGYISFRVGQVGVKGGNTVLNELRMLRTMARDSVAEGYAEKYWCDRVRPPKVAGWTKAKPNLLTPEQAARVLANVPPQWLGLILFMVTTGLRWGEASAVHWEDVDLDAMEVSIRFSNDRGKLGTTKTGKHKTVPLLPAVLEHWGEVQTAGLVFTGREGKIYKGNPTIKVLTKACEAAGVTRITTHGLRRTFNNRARQHASREVLKSITGHSTDAMVEHYSMVGGEEKAIVATTVARELGVPEVSSKPETN